MGKWRWEEDGYTVTRSVCWSAPGTHGGCGVLLYSKDGKFVKVEGDTESPFIMVVCVLKHLAFGGLWNIRSRSSTLMAYGEKYDINYMPVRTDLCSFCAGRMKTGKKPACVQHCLAGCLEVADKHEIAGRLIDVKRKQMLFL